MKCNHCGKEIANDSKFCEYCGKRQTKSNVIYTPLSWVLFTLALGLSYCFSHHYCLDDVGLWVCFFSLILLFIATLILALLHRVEWKDGGMTMLLLAGNYLYIFRPFFIPFIVTRMFYIFMLVFFVIFVVVPYFVRSKR